MAHEGYVTPPAVLLGLLVRNLAREKGYSLSPDSTATLSRMLDRAFVQLSAARGAGEFDVRGRSFLASLLTAVPVNDWWQPPENLPKGHTARAPLLPPAVLHEALRSVCPRWPFC